MNGIQEVVGSIPSSSTIRKLRVSSYLEPFFRALWRYQEYVHYVSVFPMTPCENGDIPRFLHTMLQRVPNRLCGNLILIYQVVPFVLLSAILYDLLRFDEIITIKKQGSYSLFFE